MNEIVGLPFDDDEWDTRKIIGAQLIDGATMPIKVYKIKNGSKFSI